MKIISIMNRKGGASKTTTAQALGQGLELKEFKVLYIDLDSQCNLTYVLNKPISDKSIYDVLVNGENINNYIANNLICGSTLLSTSDMKITGNGKEYRLKNSLGSIKNQYDYIIIDTPPALNILTVNAIAASTTIIIASNADILAIQGILQLKDTISIVKKQCNNDLTIDGILLTKFNLRTVLNRDLLKAFDNIANQLNTKIYKTRIRESVAIREAQIKKMNLYEYAPKNGAIKDYGEFVGEFLNG